MGNGIGADDAGDTACQQICVGSARKKRMDGNVAPPPPFVSLHLDKACSYTSI